MRRKGFVAMLAGTAAALAIVVPAAFAAPKATAVNVTAGKPMELRFTLSKKSAVKGLVTFRVTNRGSSTHDFKIAGKVTKELRPGQTATLSVTFKRAGSFPYLCTLPGHAAAGMKGVFTVK